MTQFHIKLIAAFCMVIDHIGVVFFPDEWGFRAIGRLSFPLFAWLLTQGEKYTHDIWRYVGRLAVFALISQPIYAALFQAGQLNILVTLGVGLAVVRLSKQVPEVRYLVWAAGLLITAFIPMDAGVYGFGVILLMADWFPQRSLTPTLRWWLFWLLLHGVYVWSFGLGYGVQLWALPTPLLLYGVGHRRGAKARWFYWFYPGHLAILLALATFS